LLGDFWVEEIKIERDNQQEREEKRERFTVLAGLRKYASHHVLLKGRPGSRKSTALARLLLETSAETQRVRPETPDFRPPQGKNSQIPILIELRYYQTSIIDLILQFLQRHKLPIDEKTLENFLKENDSNSLLLLFDGINELSSQTARQD
jgi:predicted NACHT family NTPase